MTAKAWIYDALGRAIRLEAVAAVRYSPASAGKPAGLEVVTVAGERCQFSGKAVAETLDALGVDVGTLRGNAEAAKVLGAKAIAADARAREGQRAADVAARQRADLAAAKRLQSVKGGTLGENLSRLHAQRKRA